MKKLSYLLLIFAAAAFVFIGCEGPEGPAGPKGDKGDQGEQGIQGETGQPGTTTCKECHNDDQVLFGKTQQWEASVHATGGHAARNDKDCALCHTSQGFLEANAAGAFANGIGNGATAAAIPNPNQPNCYTCHNIHSSYEDDDWLAANLTKTAATQGWHSVDGSTVTSVDLGSGNMCTGCHQARDFGAVLDITSDVDKDYTAFYNQYKGLHHGPQYNVLVGEGLYEFAGTDATAFPTGEAHLTKSMIAPNTCVTCHMTTAYGTKAGGHTFAMVYDDHGHDAFNWPASCTTCHLDDNDNVPNQGLDQKMEDIMEKIGYFTDASDNEGLLGDLGTELNTLGMINGGYLGLGMWSDKEMGAYLNFRAIQEGGGKGIHNYSYTIAILENTLEVVFGYDYSTPVK